MDWSVSELCSISLKIFLCESCFLAAENQTGNKRIFFKKQTIPCLSACRGVLLTTQRERRPKQWSKPPAHVLSVWEKNKTKAKPLNTHNGLVFHLPWGTKQEEERCSHHPHPCLPAILAPWHAGPPGCLLSFLPSSAGTGLTNSLTVQIAALIHPLACSLTEWLWMCETVWRRNKSPWFVGNES